MRTITRIVGGAIYFSLAAGLAFGLSYFLGHSILDGDLAGSDSPLHVAYAIWFDRYFPNVPHWYPHQGAGVSLVHGYQVLPHLLVVVLHRFSDLSILQAFRVISFVSFPLSALGVCVFCWSELRSKTAGLISSVLFLLAPVTWTWMYNWGFFAQQVAFVLLPIGLLCFNRMLNSELATIRTGVRRIWLVAFALVLCLAILGHMMVAASIVIGSLLNLTFRGILRPRGDRRHTISRGLRALILTLVLVGVAAAVYLAPFFLYGREANRNGLSTPSPSELHRLPFLEFFGLRPIDRTEILTRMQFPLVATALSFAGSVFLLAVRRRGVPEAEFGLVLSLSAAVSLVYVLSPGLSRVVLGVSKVLWYFVNFRSVLLLATVLIPVLAGFCVHSAISLLFRAGLGRGADDRNAQPRNDFPKSLRSAASALIGLGLIGLAIVPSGALATTKDIDFPFGPVVPNAEDLWNIGGKPDFVSVLTQLSPMNWPALHISDQARSIEESKKFAAYLPPDGHTRIDISPYVGPRAKDVVAYADASQINTYTFQLNLFKDMWSYQQRVMYSDNASMSETGAKRTLGEISRWFGINYVVLNAEYDPVTRYSEAGWDLMMDDRGVQLWRNTAPSSLVTATSRPVVLVIGKPKTDAYLTVFKLANEGMLSFSDALLVQGKGKVDDYDLDELELFDVLVLYGYDYRNGPKAWELLEAYVRRGGSLYIDTGWEFWIPEWEFETAPDVLPVERITWTDYGMGGEYELGTAEITPDIETSLFKPLDWEGGPWTVSGASLTDVRDWGQVVLSASGRPLIIAGNYGEGKVVWSGMNLMAHMSYLGLNEEELKLAGNLLDWLTDGKGGNDFETYAIERNHPDEVVLRFRSTSADTMWIYWREAFYPDWHAYLSDDQGEREVPVYRAGPGLMAIPLKSVPELFSVRLIWQPSVIERVGVGVSLVGIFVLVGVLVDGLLLDGNGLTWLKIAGLMRIPRPFLGDGANHEWAERKRSELKAGLFSRDHRVLNPQEAISWFPRDVNGGRGIVVAPGEGPDQAGPEISSGDQEKLLKAWLEGNSHREDEWVKKILGKGETGSGGLQ